MVYIAFVHSLNYCIVQNITMHVLCMPYGFVTILVRKNYITLITVKL